MQVNCLSLTITTLTHYTYDRKCVSDCLLHFVDTLVYRPILIRWYTIFCESWFSFGILSSCVFFLLETPSLSGSGLFLEKPWHRGISSIKITSIPANLDHSIRYLGWILHFFLPTISPLMGFEHGLPCWRGPRHNWMSSSRNWQSWFVCWEDFILNLLIYILFIYW